MCSNNGIRFNFIVAAAVIIAFHFVLTQNVRLVAGAPTTLPQSNVLRDECGHSLNKPSGFFNRHFDFKFLKKFFKHWIPFTSRPRVKMLFFLYKKDFPDCGREINPDVDETLEQSGFNAEHQTRIIIHGWLSQSKGSLNRDVKNAYLSLTSQDSHESNNSTNEDDDAKSHPPIDFNVIVVDWSVISSNVNYFSVVDMIDDLGFLVVEFVRFLQMRAGLHLDDVYLIGHSLGAQIAGSAGKQVKPFKFNTIFALDPAGPKFRGQSDDYRIDPSDAVYVESIQTSSSLGFQEPVGHATFYPNYGHDQKNCYIYGCSHSRAHDYFAESITSKKGFWGTLVKRESEKIWVLSDSGVEFRMGGEPSTPKRGTYLVKTNDRPPYAMGRQLPKLRAEFEMGMESETEAETLTEAVEDADAVMS